MKLTLAESRYFKDSILIIADLVNEAKFKIVPEYIEMVALDPANVAMVIFKMFSSAFIEYSIEEPLEIGINLNNLKSILRRAKPNDMLSIEVEENKLQITLKGKATRTFSIPLIDMEGQENKIPDLQFTAKVSTNSDILNEAIEDIDVVSEGVTFIADNKKLIIQGEGDLSKVKVEIKDDENTKIESTEVLKAKYSVEYFKKMIAAGKISDKVLLQFARDYPIKLEYKVIDKIMLGFILAPRSDTE